ncbi:MAG: hypothetical protein DLM55_08195 [Acidimicrobiales bacterium]|nr:MAG: hypothetical protein DLM55_08195 [Acidimicrobiales bacterium]
MLHNGSGMTDKEMADWHYAHRAEMDASIDENESFPMELDPNFALKMSFHPSGKEAEAIRLAAEHAGVGLSDWIRAACVAAAKDQGIAPRNEELRDVVRSLSRDVERLRTVADAA